MAPKAKKEGVCWDWGVPLLAGLGSPQSERTRRTVAELNIGVSCSGVVFRPPCGARGPSRMGSAPVDVGEASPAGTT